MNLSLFKNKDFTKNFFKLMVWGRGQFDVVLTSGEISSLTDVIESKSNDFFKNLKVISKVPVVVINGNFKPIVNQSPQFQLEYTEASSIVKVEFSTYFKFLIRLTILFSLFLLVGCAIGFSRTGKDGLAIVSVQIVAMQAFGTFIYFDIFTRSLNHVKLRMLEDLKMAFHVKS